jgi:hypothetical protein
MLTRIQSLVFGLLLLACQSSHSEPFESWTTEEKSWFAASTVAQIVDYQTTRNFLYQQPASKGYYEANPIIGPHPSPNRLAAFEIGTLIGSYLLADWLPHDYRLLYLQAHTIVEIAVVGHNLSVGARIQF